MPAAGPGEEVGLRVVEGGGENVGITHCVRIYSCQYILYIAMYMYNGTNRTEGHPKPSQRVKVDIVFYIMCAAEFFTFFFCWRWLGLTRLRRLFVNK